MEAFRFAKCSEFEVTTVIGSGTVRYILYGTVDLSSNTRLNNRH